MWDEGEVRLLAGGQRGLLTRSSILALGVDDGAIGRQLASGRWRELHPGIYYLDTTPLSWRTGLLAAVMAAGPGAVASHRSAGKLYELDGIFGSLVELTVPFNGDPDPLGSIVHRTRRPRPARFVEGIPVTSVERTLLDLAALLPDRVLEKALMSALHKRLTTMDLLDVIIATDGGRGVKGTRRFRRVLSLAAEGITGSVAEVDLADIIRDAPIPWPETQHRIVMPDGSNAYPDFAWVDRMKLVEADGYGSHSTPEKLDRDLTRQNQLMELGWEIRRFSARQISREPLIVRAELIRFING